MNCWMDEEIDYSYLTGFIGKTFLTQTGLSYGISQNKKIIGKHFLKNAEIRFLAGISPENYDEAFELTREVPSDKSRKKLYSFINDEGIMPAPGMHLIITLTREEEDKRGSLGLVSSTITDIKS